MCHIRNTTELELFFRAPQSMPILPFGPFTIRTRHGRVTVFGLACFGFPLATYIGSRLLATDKAEESPKHHPEGCRPGGED